MCRGCSELSSRPAGGRWTILRRAFSPLMGTADVSGIVCDWAGREIRRELHCWGLNYCSDMMYAVNTPSFQCREH